MSEYWSKTAASLTPYVPGEQPKDRTYIKLNTNENPYPPSPSVLAAIRDAVNEDLRLYPDPTCSRLRQTIAENYGVTAEQVFVGNGSDEILAFAFQAFFDPDKPILFPDITYSFYPVYADLYRIPYTLVPLDEDFRVPLEPFLAANGGIVLPNPNAPTALSLPLEGIRKLLEGNKDRVVVLDEAYIDFGGESAVPLVGDYPNLLVVHTLSKSRSLAGLRTGFAFGQPDLIEGLNRVKNSFNSYTLDRLALAGAEAAIRDDAYFHETVQKVARTRDESAQRLAELGFHVTDSKANFLFASHPRVPAKQLFQELRNRGILVRYFDKPRINNYLRISVGTDEEMGRLVEALTSILQK